MIERHWCLVYVIYHVCVERDQRDWMPLVCCLVQLMLEPRWRTIKGVQELIQREWVALGHDFTCRLGLLTSVEADSKQVI